MMSSPRSLTDYLRAARRRSLVILATAIVFAVAAFFAAKRLPNLYQSSASITVESATNESASDSSRRLAAIQQRLASRELLDAVIANSGLLDGSSSRAEDLLANMRAEIRVTEDAQRPGQFNIAYRANDPDMAQKVVAALTTTFVTDSAKATPAASPEVETLRQRATELSAELRQLEEKDPRLITLKDAAPPSTAAPSPRSAPPSADALRAQQMTLESLKDRQYLIQQQLADAEQRIASQKQIVEQQKKNSTLNNNPTYAALIARRTELQGQRDTLINRQELTDKHPRVAALIDQINAINRQIEELRTQDASQVSQSPEARELLALESERNRLKLELEINNREMARRALPAPAPVAAPVTTAPRDSSASRFAVQYFSLKRSYEDVMAKLDAIAAKPSADGNAKVERFRLLDQASLSQQPVWPNRWLLVLAALAAGLALGACFALFAERRRFASLQDARDVDFYTRLPLLAAIPKTVTAADQRDGARRAKLRLAFGTVMALVATVALAEIFILTNLLSLIAKN
jgi:uncharacterized protein involved in exopolysaccharide biosynthesis